jgi:hypothetical protein
VKVVCLVGCSCERHTPKKCLVGCVCRKHIPRSEVSKAKMRSARVGQVIAKETFAK